MAARTNGARGARLTTALVLLALGACGALVAGAIAAPVASDGAITQVATPDPANIGRELTYTLTVINLGPGVPKSMVATDPLPATVTFIRIAASVGGVCTNPAVGASGTVKCTWQDPAVAVAQSVQIVVKPTTRTTLTNTATVNLPGAQDPTAANDVAATNVRAIPYALAGNGERCTWVGTAAADTITGTPGKDVICGLGGDDTLYGMGGNDVLDGGQAATRSPAPPVPTSSTAGQAPTGYSRAPVTTS